MSVLRGTLPTDGYTIIPNAWLRDAALSAKAKGILCYLASHREGYELTFAQMTREMRDGEGALRTGCEELEAAGYLGRVRTREESGRFGGYEWILGEAAAQPHTEFPSPVDPAPETKSPKKTTPKKTNERPSASPRGTRLPDDFRPSEEMIIWARAEAPGIGWREHEKFLDYWRALPGQRGVKQDWVATWRNWMRKASDDLATRSRPTSDAPRLFEEMREDRARDQRTAAQVADELRERDQELSIGEALRLARELLAAGEDSGKSLSSCGPTGYIEGEVIDDREVTG